MSCVTDLIKANEAGMNKMQESAFPNEGFNGWGEPTKGMSLRDYFAGKHMQALCSTVFYTEGNLLPCEVAEHSYEMADAMLQERIK